MTAAAERYAADNRTIAQIILRDPERCGGEQAALVIWAHMVIDGYERTRADWGAAA